LIDGTVDNLRQGLFAILVAIFADSVVDDNGVVQRVAGERKETGENLQGELLIGQCKNPQGNQNVMDQAGHCPKRIGQFEDPAEQKGNRESGKDKLCRIETYCFKQIEPDQQDPTHYGRNGPFLLEPACDVDADEQHRIIDGFQGLLSKVFPDFRSDHFHPPHGGLPLPVRFGEVLLNPIRKTFEFPGNEVGANQKLVGVGCTHLLDHALGEGLTQGISDFIGIR
jgi:hypothetical protein